MKLLVESMKAEIGLHFTTKMNGKMQGMQSLSTACTVNPFCLARVADGDKICSKCYAFKQMKMYKSMGPCLENNFNILTTQLLDIMPRILVPYFRFEAFGDVYNEIQVHNYINICNANPDTKFALWTKNIAIVQAAVDKFGKPENLQIVRSSENFNDPADVNEYDCVDKVFTVYNNEYINNNNVEINCGSRKCIDCLKCYKGCGEKYINEKVK